MLYRLTLWMKRHQLRKAIRKRKFEHTLIHLVELSTLLTDDDFWAIFHYPCEACQVVGDTLHHRLTESNQDTHTMNPLVWLTGLSDTRVNEYRHTLLYGVLRTVWHDVLTPLRKPVKLTLPERRIMFAAFTHIEKHIATAIRRQHAVRKSKGRRGNGTEVGR